uniref:Uncharacterized protein n=1 Tax=Anguilla anguilla TaxID=7936 RepID=A0A0E9X3H9_ANGAN
MNGYLYMHNSKCLRVLVHLLAVCSGNFSGRSGALRFSLLLLPFLGCILFVPLLVKIAKEDICLLCHNDLLRRVFTCGEVNRWSPVRCFAHRIRMESAEIALVIDRQALQEICLVHI